MGDRMKLPAIRQLPSGNWFCQLRLDGRSISITEPTKEKCQARALAYKTGILQARREPLSVTLGAACDAYIAARVGVLSPTTLQAYETIRNNSCQELMGKRLDQITEKTLNLAIQREAQRVGRAGRKISAKSIKNSVGFFRSVLRDNGVELNHIVMPEKKRRVVLLPDPADVLRAVKGSDVELPCLLAAWLSLSMSEIRGLTKSKSIRGGQIYVAETVVRVKDKDAKGKQTDVRKEGGKEELRSRVLDLPPYLRQLIDQVDGDVIVPLTPRQIGGRFDRLLKAKGLPHMSFHQLRHLNASTMAMLGIQKEIAQERGGWKTPHTMNEVYTHTFDAQRKAADEKIDAYFSSIIDPAPPPDPLRNANKKLTEKQKHRIYRLHKA